MRCPRTGQDGRGAHHYSQVTIILPFFDCFCPCQVGFGLGGGTLASAMLRILPDAGIDVVELDPAMVRVAKEYFSFRPSPLVRVTVEDGRVFVKRALEKGEKYDVIMLDAFDQSYIPPHMMTQQFLTEVKSILTKGGVLAANTFSVSGFYDNESVTYESVYGEFYNLKRFWSNNRVIIAQQEGVPSLKVLEKNVRVLDKKLQASGVDASWLLAQFSRSRD